MKSLISILLLASVFYAGVTQAKEVTSAGQAISLCKAQAIENNDDYVSSKSKRIKETRSGYKLKLKVTLADSTVSSNCVVGKDGTITYAQS